MSKDIFLSVVIPAYNEERNVRSEVLKNIDDYLKKQTYTWEVLIVDDGSSDRTVEFSERFCKNHKGFRILKEPHKGKGGTVIAGVLKAAGEIILFTDMDQSTPLSEVEKFLPEFSQGYDIIIGSRAGRKGAPLIRKIMSIGFSLLRMLILRLSYKDTQTGFKAFKSQAGKKVFGKMKIFFDNMKVKGASTSAGFDVEMLYLARKMGMKVKEVPVEWHYEPGTKKNSIKESWIGFRGIMAVRIKSILGVYKV
ncbi:glycosyltransferase [Candidatus Microgenomates bacterium]|nr:glycosyltransferase [Candidatus Microgenomates bacterium]